MTVPLLQTNTNSSEELHLRQLRQKSSSSSAIIVGLVAAVGGFLYGYDTGLINDILEMQYVKAHIPSEKGDFNTHERALITAILSLGTFFGALVAPIISDSYGRKSSIIVSSAIIFNIGNVLQVSATDVGLLCAGRGVSGLSVGILSAIVPLYQAEASPKWVRGSIVFTYQWAITWGLLLASAICQGTRKLQSSASYRIPIGVQFVWSIVLCIGMLFLPESPRFYVQKDNIQSALQSLSKLRRLPDDDADLIEELVEIKANYDYEMSFGKTSILDCFRSGGGRHKQKLRMATGMGVHAFQQCSGINFIFYYGVNFFSSTGVGNYYLMSFFTYLVNVVFTIPGIILIEVVGRRKLLMWGGVGMSVCNFIIAIVGVSVAAQQTRSIVSIVFSCCFIACFASSWGGCTWALSADMFSISIRQKAIAITVATNWLVNFVFAFITPYLIDTGQHTAALGNRIFFIWGGLNALGIVFVYFMVYETKGLKLEEVDFMYMNCENSRASTKFVSRAIDYSTMPNGTATGVDSGIISRTATRGGKDSSSPSTGEGGVGFAKDSSMEMSDLRHRRSPNHNNNNVHLVAHDNMLAPTLSNTSSESSPDSTMSTPGVSDYQKYLSTLREQSGDKVSRTSSSHTSAPTHRLYKCGSKTGNGEMKITPIKRQSSEASVIPNPGSSYTSTSLQEGIGKKGGLVNAASFFASPPSDSDSDDSNEDGEEETGDAAKTEGLKKETNYEPESSEDDKHNN
ncbi:hypothetical protein FT663_02487 [Candidozyma haemuli var. vulneris]|uniref:Major facilitator superfamily (MFS) profile domain-containing protein n=1 Tax=Candidozyma haemuli TaxID=45357 RepID=A0A2V1AYU8_9ASCO|nr:hypothetical protein CXQ85_005250 [[Candida] haemuloni]KAF3991928.1 hypothetical protein FT663_02487 [[Candida] haemuloni var. vulneris]KAF3991963.1 hypothetical protein FT662_01416 [[Candida] haemuloni var. vulneris]PVH22676.1 hypothetical protein CXQ85_005250 [[Candida] haemuloni]